MNLVSIKIGLARNLIVWSNEGAGKSKVWKTSIRSSLTLRGIVLNHGRFLYSSVSIADNEIVQVVSHFFGYILFL